VVRALPLLALLPLLLASAQEGTTGPAVYAREACWQCHAHATDPFPQIADARRAGPVIGARGPARSPEWHLAHLHSPRATSAGSEMPSYAHLFAGHPRAAEVEAFLKEHDRDGDGVVTRKECDDFRGLDTGNGIVSRADAAPIPSPDALALVRYLLDAEQPAADGDATPRTGPPADRADAAARGRALFLASCAGCHGDRADGNGPAAPFFPDHPPRNLRRGDYKFRSTKDPAPLDEDLFRTIRRGAGPSMPAWPDLSEAQVWDLVLYLKSIHPYFLTQELFVTEAGGAGGARIVQEGADTDDASGAALEGGAVRKEADGRWWWIDASGARPVEDGMRAGRYAFRLGRPVYDWMEEFRPEPLPVPEPPFPYSEESAEKGMLVYRELQCASCHGLEGKGDGAAAADTRGNLGEVVPPTDYTRGARWFKGGGDARSIVRTFLTGLHGTPMPSFATNFRAVTSVPAPGAPWNLAHYVMRQAAIR
jgi:mono/diheme cytochrome c family protein